MLEAAEVSVFAHNLLPTCQACTKESLPHEVKFTKYDSKLFRLAKYLNKIVPRNVVNHEKNCFIFIHGITQPTCGSYDVFTRQRRGCLCYDEILKNTINFDWWRWSIGCNTRMIHCCRWDVIAHPCPNASGSLIPQIARFMGPTWSPSGADRTQVGPMLAPWTLLSGPRWT